MYRVSLRTNFKSSCRSWYNGELTFLTGFGLGCFSPLPRPYPLLLPLDRAASRFSPSEKRTTAMPKFFRTKSRVESDFGI